MISDFLSRLDFKVHPISSSWAPKIYVRKPISFWFSIDLLSLVGSNLAAISYYQLLPPPSEARWIPSDHKLRSDHTGAWPLYYLSMVGISRIVSWLLSWSRMWRIRIVALCCSLSTSIFRHSSALLPYIIVTSKQHHNITVRHVHNRKHHQHVDLWIHSVYDVLL